jgi:hypothetical protein
MVNETWEDQYKRMLEATGQRTLDRQAMTARVDLSSQLVAAVRLG